MFHTARSAFSVEHSPFRRDIVREFVEAFREAGLRVGLYFSLLDWHHPDYPPWRDDCRPYMPGRWPQPTPEQWERYIEFMFAQVRELLTNYGRIDLIWFDGQWERTPDQWRAKELEAMIRDLQPDIVINDRLPGCGDYDTPEQFVPATAPERPWEVCLTMNESWGYNPSDTGYKSAREIVHTLCEIAAKGGRLLLNLSPRGDGTVPPEQVERLEAVGAWLQRHGEAIFGTEPALEPWQFYGPTTRSAHVDATVGPAHAEGTRGASGGDSVVERIYLHLLMRPYETVTVRGLPIRRDRRRPRARFRPRTRVHHPLLHPRPAPKRRPPRRADDRGARGCARPARDGDCRGNSRGRLIAAGRGILVHQASMR